MRLKKELEKPLTNKRNVWIPKMTVTRLERLLRKTHLTDNDKEDLLDYKYLLLNDVQSAIEKGFYYAVDSNCATGYTPKNKHWIANIDYLTAGFKSKYNINITRKRC
jgi:hypothetical protein